MAEPGRHGAAIRVRDLAFGYGDAFRLRIRALDVGAGESIACIGPSGSGKTTFLHLCAGILRPPEGSITVGGVDVGALSDKERRALRVSRIGLVFQEFELLEHLDVRENVLLPYLVHPALRLDDEVEGRAHRLLGSAGLGALARRRPRNLSQGERQRVAICRALVTAPSLVLADEPTGNLDPRTARRVLDLLLAATEEHGATLVLVTHDHGLLPRLPRTIDFERFAEVPA